MSKTFPYLLYSCSCTELSKSDEEEEQSFNPHLLKANYALYPIEYLLFCDECHELRCPRCYYEEVLYYFCPSCLFEVQSSAVKSESNRCTRNCFQCPVCIAPLSLNGFQAAESSRTETPTVGDGPYILSCPYCGWSSLDIGIKLEKNVNISGQLARIKNGGEVQTTPARTGSQLGAAVRSPDMDEVLRGAKPRVPDRYSTLATFYRNQLAETTPSGPLALSQSFGFDSPGRLSHLLSTYGLGNFAKRKAKLPLMREANNEDEGLQYTSEADEENVIAKMRDLAWEGTTSIEQRSNEVNNTRFQAGMRPIATKLRSKRAKRCRACRRNLVRPDEKRQSTRYKIRIVAADHIPYLTLNAFESTTNCVALIPHKPIQFLLTFRNPLSNPVKVTLATPPVTPGKISSRVTVLCPQFEIGSSSDLPEDTLATGTKNKQRFPATPTSDGQQAEAGKVWGMGRNWTTVILEVVPGQVREEASIPSSEIPVSESDQAQSSSVDGEDDGFLEVPLFVRIEYETDQTKGSVDADDTEENPNKAEKVQKEICYWCVLGVGRILVK